MMECFSNGGEFTRPVGYTGIGVLHFLQMRRTELMRWIRLASKLGSCRFKPDVGKAGARGQTA